MAELVLGPVVRSVGLDDATFWVETDRACTVEVLGHSTRTFAVEGHHYALVEVDGLEPGTEHPYTVRLDGEQVWPPAEFEFPPSRVRTWAPGQRFRMLVGSCHQAEPHEEPRNAEEREDAHEIGPDTLYLWAHQLAAGARPWPDSLVLVGDQVYADETHPATVEVLERRRGGPPRPGWPQVTSFEEYTWLYQEAWSVPPMRWLLSCIPASMVFDDHDVIDDWNTSISWRRQIEQEPWWPGRIQGALMSYWIYQHVGNGAPREPHDDELLARVCAADADGGRGGGGEPLREVAARADHGTPGDEGHQWSYRRDMGPVRLLVIDSRNGRVLEPESRAMVDAAEWDWIETNATGDVEHLVLVTSLPWLLPRPIHDLEAWDEQLAEGAWGRLGSRFGEWLRQTADLEHWAAFGTSFHALADLLASIGRGERGRPPSSILVLSGDIHFSYVAEPEFAGVRSTIRQIVSSPIRQAVSHVELRVQKALGHRPLRWLPRALARSTPGAKPRFDWEVTDGPWFGNNMVLLTFDDGPEVRIEVVGAVGPGEDDEEARLEPLLDRVL